MKESSYLIFRLNESLYGISTVHVEEVFPLPKLTPIASDRPEFVGTVNLRGDVLSVVDLNLHLGYPLADYRLTDNIAILRGETIRMGVIVNEVREVRDISPEKLTAISAREQELMEIEPDKIIAGVVRDGGDIFILSNPENWLPSIDIQPFISVDDSPEQEILDDGSGERSQSPDSEIFCPNATPEERAIFKRRADELALSIENQAIEDLIPLAVIVLSGELFGITLAMVREFTEIRQVTPIPCCPARIVGNMNLRGEILTLVDIRELLNLPPTDIADSSKVMVVEVEGIVTGIVVEEVRDVMFLLNPSEITDNHSRNGKFLQGTAPYNEQTMSLLDLPSLFFKGGLILNQVI
jgi:purine-binding chemotaxis protein CheW